MGSWGVGAFDNDEAGDWIAELDPERGFQQAREALGRVRADAPAWVGQQAVAAAAVIALSRGATYPAPADVRLFLRELRRPASDKDARTAARALQMLLDLPNELLELWGESPELAEWQAHLARWVSHLASPAGQPPDWGAEANEAAVPEIRRGNIYELPLSDGRRFYVQVATPSQLAWLTRVLPGVYEGRPATSEIVALAAQPEEFVHVVIGIDQFPLVAQAPVPSGFDGEHPLRMIKGLRWNPKGWLVLMPDGSVLSDDEFARRHPGVDQTRLPPNELSPGEALIEMLERGRDPRTGLAYAAAPSE